MLVKRPFVIDGGIRAKGGDFSDSKSHITLPSGATEDREVDAKAGSIRLNRETDSIEFRGMRGWKTIHVGDDVIKKAKQTSFLYSLIFS